MVHSSDGTDAISGVIEPRVIQSVRQNKLKWVQLEEHAETVTRALITVEFNAWLRRLISFHSNETLIRKDWNDFWPEFGGGGGEGGERRCRWRKSETAPIHQGLPSQLNSFRNWISVWLEMNSGPLIRLICVKFRSPERGLFFFVCFVLVFVLVFIWFFLPSTYFFVVVLFCFISEKEPHKKMIKEFRNRNKNKRSWRGKKTSKKGCHTKETSHFIQTAQLESFLIPFRNFNQAFLVAL